MLERERFVGESPVLCLLETIPGITCSSLLDFKESVLQERSKSLSSLVALSAPPLSHGDKLLGVSARSVRKELRIFVDVVVGNPGAVEQGSSP